MMSSMCTRACPRTPSMRRTTSGRWSRAEPHHPAVRFEFRLENQRARPVAALRWSGLSSWAHDPAPVAGLAEEGGEARAGVEAGKTQPVDRSVPSHEGGRLRVAEDGVVFYAHKP